MLKYPLSRILAYVVLSAVIVAIWINSNTLFGCISTTAACIAYVVCRYVDALSRLSEVIAIFVGSVVYVACENATHSAAWYLHHEGVAAVANAVFSVLLFKSLGLGRRRNAVLGRAAVVQSATIGFLFPLVGMIAAFIHCLLLPSPVGSDCVGTAIPIVAISLVAGMLLAATTLWN